MKVVILAGGFGTRISEESHLKPKPMIEIGERPILWHIMKGYSHHGFNDFIVCLGYKGYSIRDYFAHYYLYESDVTFDFRHSNQRFVHNHSAEPWSVTLVNTGLETATGGRVKRIQQYVGGETFMMTYGDGVSDIDIEQLLAFHRSHGKIATITSIQPGGRYGAMDLTDDGQVRSFKEKPKGEGGWVSAGFFVFEPKVFDYIAGDSIFLEKEPLERLACEGEIKAFRHGGFWQSMDTMRDRILLEDLWKSGKAPWVNWDLGIKNTERVNYRNSERGS